MERARLDKLNLNPTRAFLGRFPVPPQSRQRPQQTNPSEATWRAFSPVPQPAWSVAPANRPRTPNARCIIAGCSLAHYP